jgi:hypothetical protein
MGKRAIKRKALGFGRRGTGGVTVPREGSWSTHWVERWQKLWRTGEPSKTRVKKGFGFKRS